MCCSVDDDREAAVEDAEGLQRCCWTLRSSIDYPRNPCLDHGWVEAQQYELCGCSCAHFGLWLRFLLQGACVGLLDLLGLLPLDPSIARFIACATFALAVVLHHEVPDNSTWTTGFVIGTSGVGVLLLWLTDLQKRRSKAKERMEKEASRRDKQRLLDTTDAIKEQVDAMLLADKSHSLTIHTSLVNISSSIERVYREVRRQAAVQPPKSRPPRPPPPPPDFPLISNGNALSAFSAPLLADWSTPTSIFSTGVDNEVKEGGKSEAGEGEKQHEDEHKQDEDGDEKNADGGAKSSGESR